MNQWEEDERIRQHKRETQAEEAAMIRNKRLTREANAWISGFSLVFVIVGAFFVSDWRAENTERLDTSELVALCSTVDDVVACIEAVRAP